MAGEGKESGCDGSRAVGQGVIYGGDTKEVLESVHGGSRKLEEECDCVFVVSIGCVYRFSIERV